MKHFLLSLSVFPIWYLIGIWNLSWWRVIVHHTNCVRFTIIHSIRILSHWRQYHRRSDLCNTGSKSGAHKSWNFLGSLFCSNNLRLELHKLPQCVQYFCKPSSHCLLLFHQSKNILYLNLKHIFRLCIANCNTMLLFSYYYQMFIFELRHNFIIWWICRVRRPHTPRVSLELGGRLCFLWHLKT